MEEGGSKAPGIKGALAGTLAADEGPPEWVWLAKPERCLSTRRPGSPEGLVGHRTGQLIAGDKQSRDKQR